MLPPPSVLCPHLACRLVYPLRPSMHTKREIPLALLLLSLFCPSYFRALLNGASPLHSTLLFSYERTKWQTQLTASFAAAAAAAAASYMSCDGRKWPSPVRAHCGGGGGGGDFGVLLQRRCRRRDEENGGDLAALCCLWREWLQGRKREREKSYIGKLVNSGDDTKGRTKNCTRRRSVLRPDSIRSMDDGE